MIGVDLVKIERIKKAIERHGDAFTQKFLSASEIKDSKHISSIAAKWAAKEAVSKALGTGVRNFNLTDLEILNDELGKPIIYFNEKLEKLEKDYEIHLSISHCKNYATATAIIFKK